MCYLSDVLRPPNPVLFGSCSVLLALAGCASDPPPAKAPIVASEPAPESAPSPCAAPPRPGAAVHLVPAFRGLTVSAPVALVQAPSQAGDPGGRWFLLDQHGLVHTFFETSDGATQDHQTTDLRDRVAIRKHWLDERGLLGIALHADFPKDPRAFLAYTAQDPDLVLRISSFVVDKGKLDDKSEVRLLEVPEPYSNHNGGHVAFGPDGYLYASVGDGGAADDPHENGQNTETLLGTILRIDVNHTEVGKPYAIPEGNPFKKGGGRPEIYAWGLRNPWRFSFDRTTGELWAGDVGQETYEEINRIEVGGNYGWNVFEGFECFPIGTSGCSSEGMKKPVYVYEHDRGSQRSITGGVVYRGSWLPELVGRYLFADYETGSISALELPAPGQAAKTAKRLTTGGFRASSFAEDQAGEILLLDYATERILRILPGKPDENALPTLISDTRCVDPQNPTRPAVGAIPYEVAVPFWSDGAEKQRYLYLPEGKRLKVLPDGDLEVPVGTVLQKNFLHQGRLFETRFYVRHLDGEYTGYSYAWRKDGSNAELVLETREARVGDLNWIFPGRDACHQCHTQAAGRTLGLELRQLKVGDQLERLVAAGALEEADVASQNTLEAFGKGSLDARARAYLHVNCSGCHRPGGPARGIMDLRFDTPRSQTGLCEKSTLDADGRMRLAPGDSARSVIHERMSRRDERGMPPLASLAADREGANLLARWITSLESCP